MRVGHISTVGRIAEVCKGKIASGDPGAVIETITTDSRNLGKKNLFIPLIGERFDGHDFIKELSENKRIISYLTMKDGFTEVAVRNNISEIFCNDTLKAMGLIASSHRDGVSPKVTGITGTNGKTTTKELVYRILSSKYRCLKNEKNYNNEIGVPITLLGLRDSDRAAIIEMGMNHFGELDRLSRIVKPDISLITNVGEGHLEFLGTVENVALAKSEIMHGMKPGSTIFINREMSCFDIIRKKALKMELRIKTFGLSDSADIYPESYNLYRNKIEVFYGGEKISVPLYGIHNLYNIIAAVSIACEYGIKPQDIKAALSDFSNVEGRSQIIDTGFIVINDTYNSNPLSLKYALESANEIFPGKRKIAVLSDMKELGESSKLYHIESGKAVGENGFSMLYVWGDMSKCYIDGAKSSGMLKKNLIHFNNKDELSGHLKRVVSDNDVVLIKGSRSMKMEDIVYDLTGREE